MVRRQRWKFATICSSYLLFAAWAARYPPATLNEEVQMASNDPKVDLLKSVSIFSGMGERELEQVAQLLDEVEVPAGKVLMRQGDNGNEMFIIAKGRVQVERNGKVISERGPGSTMGEVSLLSEGPRTATVTALEPSTLLYAAHREFHSLMDAHPSVRLCILNGLAAKIRLLDEAAVH
jgi:CRP-like cAMP-binding protein